MERYKIDLQELRDRGFNGYPLEATIKENFPNARFEWEDFYKTIFEQDGAYMTMLQPDFENRVWLMVYQILPNEWIVSITEEGDKGEKELYRIREFCPCEDEWEKAFIPSRLIINYFSE